MASDPNNCIGCLSPPCKIHNKKRAKKPSTTKTKTKKRSRIFKKSSNSRPLRKSKRIAVQTEEATNVNINSANEHAEQCTPSCSRKGKKKLQMSKNENQFLVETENISNSQSTDVSCQPVDEQNEECTNDNQETAIEAQDDKPSTSSFSRGQKKRFQRSICVVHPFVPQQNTVNTNNSQNDTEEDERYALNPSPETQQMLNAAINQLFPSPLIPPTPGRPSTLETPPFSPLTPSPPPLPRTPRAPIFESGGRMNSQNLAAVNPSIQHVRDSNREVYHLDSSMQQRNEVIQRRAPIFESGGRINSQNLAAVNPSIQQQRNEVIQRNIQAQGPSNNNVSHETNRTSSNISQEIRETIHQSQSGHIYYPPINIFSREQLNAIQEAERMNSDHRYQQRSPIQEFSSASESDSDSSEPSYSEPMPQFGTNATQASNEGVELFLPNNPFSYHHNIQSQSQTRDPNYAANSIQSTRDFTQLSACRYAEENSGASRAVNRGNPNNSIVAVGQAGFPEHMTPEQFMQQNPHFLSGITSMPNWSNTSQSSWTDMRMAQEQNMASVYSTQLERSLPRAHRPTSTIVSNTINQYPSYSGPTDNQRITEQLMHDHNYAQRSNNQSVLENYNGPNQLPSTPFGCPYHANCQRSSTAGNNYQNYSQQTSNNESVVNVYGPVVSDGSYHNYFQGPSNNESVPDRYRLAVPDGSHEYRPYQPSGMIPVANQNIFKPPEMYQHPNISMMHPSRQQIFMCNIFNRSQTYDNQAIPNRFLQSPPQTTSRAIAAADPRTTRESMQNFNPSISQPQHQSFDNLSSPDRYWQQPPSTSQMNSNSRAPPRPPVDACRIS